MKKNNKLTEQFIKENIKINASFSSYPVRQEQKSEDMSLSKSDSVDSHEAQIAMLK